MGCDVTIGELRGALNAASSALEEVANVTFDSPRQSARILSDMRPVLLLCLAHIEYYECICTRPIPESNRFFHV